MVLFALEEATRIVEIGAEPSRRCLGDGDDSLFFSFSADANLEGGKVDVMSVETCELADSERAAVEQLHHAPIAQAKIGKGIGAGEEPLDLGVGKGKRNSFFDFEGGNLEGRVDGNIWAKA